MDTINRGVGDAINGLGSPKLRARLNGLDSLQSLNRMMKRMETSAEGIRLVVNADDFGVCHAVNEGIVKAFREGIVTQTSIMAPTPWFPEAASLARQHRIPVILHSTFTAEWDNVRWRPLTAGASLARADGTSWPSVEDAVAHLVPAEAEAELEAQYQAIVREGLRPLAVDFHMGIVSEAAMRSVAARHGIPACCNEVSGEGYDTTAMLSDMPRERKVPWLLEWLAGLAPGLHRLLCHPGVDSPELGALTSRKDWLSPWAREYRISDTEALCDPRVRESIKARKIKLTSLAEAGGTS